MLCQTPTQVSGTAFELELTLAVGSLLDALFVCWMAATCMGTDSTAYSIEQ